MRGWNWPMIGLAIGLLASIIVLALVSARYTEQKATNEKLVVQNVQLTKDVREAKAQSYRMGIIACGNEDVAYLNKQAKKYYGTVLGQLFQQMAQGWTYTDDTLNQMVEGYMNGETY